MANTVIALKKSATPSSVPADLANGELAINYADGKLYYKAANGTIASISGNEPNYFGSVSANGTLIVADVPGDILTLEAGPNITIVGDAISDKITISSTAAGGGITYTKKTSSYTANSGDGIIADTASGAFDVTLPASPSVGSQVVIVDGNDWSANTLTVLRNGSTIEGINEDLVLDVAGTSVTFVYDGTTWETYFQLGVSNIDVANSVLSVAGLAFDKANAGLATANASYAFGNSAHSIANLAFTHANAAFSSSNSVNTYTNSTFVKLTATSQTITGDVDIVGNLTLSGNTFAIDATRLEVDDPLIYLAANNYTSDIVDIGFIANYVNATGQNVHTGLYREHENKEYYLFQGYDKEPINNHIGALSNNMTLAVLNADIKTSNIILGGANAILTIGASFNQANTARIHANAAFDVANTALPNTSGVSFNGNLNFPTGNIGIGTNSPGLSASANRKYLTLRGLGTSSGDGCGILQFTSNTPHSIVTTLGNIEWNVFDNSGSSSTRVAYVTASRSGSAANNVGSYLAFATKSDGVSGAGTERMRIDANGNIGFGVVPSSWSISSGITALQIKGASLYSSTRELGTLSNAYYNAGWNYIDSAAASQYLQSSGEHYWYSASSGTAGSAITFIERMRIDANGNVGIGTSNPAGWTAKFAAVGSVLSGGQNYVAAFSDGINSTFRIGQQSGITNLVTDTALALYSSSTERMRIDSSGKVGIGTASPSYKLTSVYSGSNTAITDYVFVGGSETYQMVGLSENTAANEFSITNKYSFGGIITLRTGTGGTISERMRIDSAGNVGIGGSPSFKLDVFGNSPSTATVARVYNANTSSTSYAGFDAGTGEGVSLAAYSYSGAAWFGTKSNHPLIVLQNNTERMRITSSGSIGIGTSAPRTQMMLLGAAQNTSAIDDTGASGGTLTIASSVNAFNSGGTLLFAALNDSSTYTPQAAIKSLLANGTANGIGDLAFSLRATTGATTLTECMRITSAGRVLISTTNADPIASNAAGTAFINGVMVATANNDIPIYINRKTSDGTLIAFYQDATLEGSISVSGTTVTYGAFSGSHWSQLSDNSRPDILVGTVVETIDEKCEWPGQENEQLVKFKVSDMPASKRVYGVFMSWDNDDEENNDAYITSLGAYLIRIAAGHTVEGGDLLESNGDGCARVQVDDIIRSSTIGKVTSNIPTHTYEDGSYTVPCVLYCG